MKKLTSSLLALLAVCLVGCATRSGGTAEGLQCPRESEVAWTIQPEPVWSSLSPEVNP